MYSGCYVFLKTRLNNSDIQIFIFYPLKIRNLWYLCFFTWKKYTLMTVCFKKYLCWLFFLSYRRNILPYCDQEFSHVFGITSRQAELWAM